MRKVRRVRPYVVSGFSRTGIMLAVLLTGAVLHAQEAPLGDGSTGLHWASYHDNLDKADQLLRAGADVNAANDLGATPLWTASLNGSSRMVRRLLAAGADPNRALIAGETPLMVGARSGNAEVVQLLLDKGANPNARGPRNQTALMWAVSQKHVDVVKVLLARGADVHARSAERSQMVAVPPHGYRDNNRIILQGGDTALMFAARVGDLASAKLLVTSGANVNDTDAWGVSATTLAAHSGFGDLVEFLLERGADPNAAKAGFAALHAAIMRRDDRVIDALLAKGADANAPLRVWTPTRRSADDFHFQPALVGATPFWLAARFGQPDVMRRLAKHGADPLFVHDVKYAAAPIGNDYPVKHERTTALMAASGMGGGTPWVQIDRAEREALALEAVKVGAELGIDVNAANVDGRTALDAARLLKYDSVVKFLEARSATAGTPREAPRRSE